MNESDYPSRDDARGYLKVREALREWDPIGVYRTDTGWPPDEYDSYIPQIIRLLDAGCAERDLAKELREIASKMMCMSVPLGHALAIAKKLVQFWKERKA